MKKDRLNELGADKLHELVLKMDEYMKRTSLEGAFTYKFSTGAEEELRNSLNIISRVPLTGVEFCPFNAANQSLTLLNIIGGVDERAEQLAETVNRLSDRYERLAYLRKEYMEAYINHPSFRSTSSKEKELLVQNQPLQEPYSQTP